MIFTVAWMGFSLASKSHMCSHIGEKNAQIHTDPILASASVLLIKLLLEVNSRMPLF